MCFDRSKAMRFTLVDRSRALILSHPMLLDDQLSAQRRIYKSVLFCNRPNARFFRKSMQ